MSLSSLLAPVASDSKEDLADWLELRSLTDGDLSSSLQDLVRELRRNGSADAFEDPSDRGSADSQRIAEDALGELDSRRTACGEEYYPYTVKGHSIALKSGYERSAYVFQLLLSRFGLVHEARLPSPEKTFEELAACAARRYLGHDDSMAGYAFGFPRRHEAKSFQKALDDLCGRIGEGGGAKVPTADAAGIALAKKMAEQKDGKVDVIAWRPFPDRRAGKLIGFGQCATGNTGWRQKLSELQPRVFMDLWLRESFSCTPVRMFFVPRRVEESEWRFVSVQAGVLFDRCRIALHCGPLSAELASECAAWTNRIVASKLKSGRDSRQRGRATGRTRSKATATKGRRRRTA